MGLKRRDSKILWAKAMNRCSYRYKGDICDRELVISQKKTDTVVGEECHIVGKKEKSPRHVPHYDNIDSYQNYILLCPTHHKLIDENLLKELIRALLELLENLTFLSNFKN
jgi:hypothetical protein